jgi:hypothetical protein
MYAADFGRNQEMKLLQHHGARINALHGKVNSKLVLSQRLLVPTKSNLCVTGRSERGAHRVPEWKRQWISHADHQGCRYQLPRHGEAQCSIWLYVAHTRAIFERETIDCSAFVTV